MCRKAAPPGPDRPLPRWLLGMAVATLFTATYLLVPFYLLTAALALLLRHPRSLLYASPMLLSILVPPRPSRLALRLFRPMLDYFDFESIRIDESATREKMSGGKAFVFVAQPHGVLSFVGMCAAVSSPDDAMSVRTGVASVVLRAPLLKNLMGFFNLVDASAGSLRGVLSRGNSVVLYVGGIAELFKSCRDEERLYLARRKGFVKLALREGADLVPIYLFGNTSVLSVMRHGPLAALSRRVQASLTWFWGKWYLPIPRDEKLLYVVGRPLGMPHIPDPTQEDIDRWHGAYCDEVRKLFETYKERVPMYKHKKLYID